MNRRFFRDLPKIVPPPYHAFFSAEAARLYGYGIWETADGRLVAVTSAIFIMPAVEEISLRITQ